jgi:hypothetical protein
MFTGGFIMGLCSKSLFIAVSSLAVAACAGGGMVMTHSTFYDYRYYPSQVMGYGAPMPVEVRGAAPGGESPAEVAAAIRLPNYINRSTVLAEPGETGPRLVVAFARASGRALCAPGGGAQATATALTVSGAYCVGDQPYTSGITDGRGGDLGQTLSAMARAILPQYNPEHRRLQFNE